MKSVSLFIFINFILIPLAFSASLSSSNKRSNCSEIIDRLGLVDIHQRATTNDCVLSIKPYRGPGLIYRSYLFTSKGLLMVFNSYGPGGIDKTGAREFYFFPRTAYPSFEDLGENIKIRTSDPYQFFIMDKENGRFLDFSFGSISEDPIVSATNNGGIEIQSQGLILDVGYMQGNSPAADPKRKSVFHDGQGNSCQVQNKEVFRYFGTGDVDFKFEDRDLRTFLKLRCPNLIIGF